MELNFKTYTDTKTIKAVPMDVKHAKGAGANAPNQYFEIDNASYDPSAEGYLVIYADGYRSWSPKKAFEDAYRVSETYIDRMKIELADLNERICKATRAINTFGQISNDERWSLSEQLDVMQKYADILYNRIRYAIEPPATVSSEPGCCKAATRKEVNNGTVD